MAIKDKLVCVPQFALKWPRVGPGALQPCHIAMTFSKTLVKGITAWATFTKAIKRKVTCFLFAQTLNLSNCSKLTPACRRKGAESSRIQVVASNYDNNYNYKAGIAETAYHAKKKVTPTKNSWTCKNKDSEKSQPVTEETVDGAGKTRLLHFCRRLWQTPRQQGNDSAWRLPVKKQNRNCIFHPTQVRSFSILISDGLTNWLMLWRLHSYHSGWWEWLCKASLPIWIKSDYFGESTQTLGPLCLRQRFNSSPAGAKDLKLPRSLSSVLWQLSPPLQQQPRYFWFSKNKMKLKTKTYLFKKLGEVLVWDQVLFLWSLIKSGIPSCCFVQVGEGRMKLFPIRGLSRGFHQVPRGIWEKK